MSKLSGLFLWGKVVKVRNVLMHDDRKIEFFLKLIFSIIIEFWKQSPFKHFDEANYLVIYVRLTLLIVLAVNEGNFSVRIFIIVLS